MDKGNIHRTSRHGPRYSLRVLLLIFSLLAVGLLVVLRATTQYRGNYRQVVRQLQAIEQIYDPNVFGDDEAGTRDVEILTFRIKGKPDSYVEIWNPDVKIFKDAERICLAQIADMRVEVVYSRPQESTYSGCTDIGPDSFLRPLLPFTVSNLGELIARYDDLVEYFETWPESPEVKTLRLPSGQSVKYYRWKLSSANRNGPSS